MTREMASETGGHIQQAGPLIAKGRHREAGLNAAPSQLAKVKFITRVVVNGKVKFITRVVVNGKRLESLQAGQSPGRFTVGILVSISQSGNHRGNHSSHHSTSSAYANQIPSISTCPNHPQTVLTRAKWFRRAFQPKLQ